MIISINQRTLTRLVRYISKQIHNWRQDKVADLLEVSPVTLSRQINNEKIDVSFLHRYLVAANLIDKSLPCPQLDTFEAYLSLLPKDSQKRIIAELIND